MISSTEKPSTNTRLKYALGKIPFRISASDGSRFASSGKCLHTSTTSQISSIRNREAKPMMNPATPSPICTTSTYITTPQHATASMLILGKLFCSCRLVRMPTLYV